MINSSLSPGSTFSLPGKGSKWVGAPDSDIQVKLFEISQLINVQKSESGKMQEKPAVKWNVVLHISSVPNFRSHGAALLPQFVTVTTI